MAKKKNARRRSSGYTVGPAPIRRRKLNGAKRKGSRRRIGAVGASLQTDAINVVQMAVGAIAGGMVIGLAERITPNYYVRAGGTAVVGLMVGKFMPKAKMIGYGMATAGVVGIGTKLLNDAGITPGALNGKRKVSPERIKQLVAELKAKGLNAGAGRGTLTSANDKVLVGAFDRDMFV